MAVEAIVLVCSISKKHEMKVNELTSNTCLCVLALLANQGLTKSYTVNTIWHV